MALGQQRGSEPDWDAGEAKRALVAGSVGHFVEWYDFAIYAYLVPEIATIFFPSGNRTAAVLSTLALFGVAFFARPLGGAVWGHLGDRVGRRGILATVILVMGASTVAIGLLPTYGQIGVLAPLLLLVCRLLQGFSAGGEVSGAASFLAEYAPANRRGLWASASQAVGVFAFVVGAVVALLLTSTLSEDALTSWGWRVPFLLAGPLALVGLYLRLRMDETPAFQAIERTDQVDRAPIMDVVSNHPRQLLLLFGIVSLESVAFYTLATYVSTYLVETMGLDSTSALLSNSLALAFFAVLVPVFASLGDRFGRKPLLLAGTVGLILISVPGFLLAGSGGLLNAVVGQLIIVVPLVAVSSVVIVLQVELFPTRVRYSGASLGYNAAYMIFGGTAPFVGAFLVARTGSVIAPAIYLVVMAVLGLWIILKLPETSKLPLLRGDEGRPMENTEVVSET